MGFQIFRYSDLFSSHCVSSIMPFQIFPLWVRIRKSKIALVTSVTYGYYGGDSTKRRTICYVSSPPTRRELRPKARSESREFRLIFEPAQFPSSSTTRVKHTNDKDDKWDVLGGGSHTGVEEAVGLKCRKFFSLLTAVILMLTLVDKMSSKFHLCWKQRQNLLFSCQK